MLYLKKSYVATADSIFSPILWKEHVLLTPWHFHLDPNHSFRKKKTTMWRESWFATGSHQAQWASVYVQIRECAVFEPLYTHSLLSGAASWAGHASALRTCSFLTDGWKGRALGDFYIMTYSSWERHSFLVHKLISWGRLYEDLKEAEGNHSLGWSEIIRSS